MTSLVNKHLWVPAEKIDATMTLFRRWQERWVDASLKAPTIRESGAFKIGPPPHHDTNNNILQFEVVVTWEAPSIRVKETHSATGVEVQHDKLHVEGEKLFSHNDQWDTVFDKVISRHGAGRYVSTAGFITLSEKLIAQSGFLPSSEAQSSRDIIVDLLKRPRDYSSITIADIKQCNAFLSLDEKRKHYQRIFSKAGGNSYFTIAQEVLSKPFLDLNNTMHTGILASLPNTLKQHCQEKKPAIHTSDSNVSQTIGNPKERGKLKLRLRSRKPQLERQYPTVAYFFDDAKGRLFEWYASEKAAVDINKGDVVTLDATIKKHRQRGDGTWVTVLTRCAEITPSSHEDPEPSFSEGVKKRSFKEVVDAKITLINDNGSIDGSCHVDFSREWKQNNNIHRYHKVLPLSGGENVVEKIREEMNRLVGKTSSAKKEAKWIDAVKTAVSPYLATPTLPQSLYAVDDATEAPFSCNEDKEQVFSSNTQRVTRPILFVSRAQASDYSRRYTFSRISELSWKSPKIKCVPSNAKHISVEQQAHFLSLSLQDGVDILAYYDLSNTTFTKLVPVSLRAGIELSGVKIKSQLIGQYKKERHLSKKLIGRQILAITGIYGNENFNNTLNTLRRNAIDLERMNIDTRWLKQATNLGGVADAYATPRGTDSPVLMIVDAVTACVMEELGATVYQVHISENPTLARTKNHRRVSAKKWSISDLPMAFS